jgi:hypothetical protein
MVNQPTPDAAALQAQNRQLQQQLDAVNQQIESMRLQQQQQHLQALPADQRPLYQQQMDIERRERELAQQTQVINEQAREIHANRLSLRTGVPIEQLMTATTREEMDTMAMDAFQSIAGDPEKLRNMADWVEGLRGGAPAEPAAPAAVATPAGVDPTTAATGAVGPDPTVAITDAYKGKGASSVAEWLDQMRSIPMTDVNMRGESAPMTVAAPPPAPAAQPAAQPAPSRRLQ